LKKFIPLFFILLIGCRNEHELIMERGIQYYEWEMIEKAVMEFKQVTQSLNSEFNTLDHANIKLLSRAHHNLAVAYAKKEWYSDAIIEAKRAFELYPSNDNKKVLELIKNKLLTTTDPSTHTKTIQ
tara:strand:+ start:152 stop:529 length:378 start_codon:yes stop_codon:yes gene_type:complete